MVSKKSFRGPQCGPRVACCTGLTYMLVSYNTSLGYANIFWIAVSIIFCRQEPAATGLAQTKQTQKINPEANPKLNDNPNP